MPPTKCLACILRMECSMQTLSIVIAIAEKIEVVARTIVTYFYVVGGGRLYHYLPVEIVERIGNIFTHECNEFIHVRCPAGEPDSGLAFEQRLLHFHARRNYTHIRRHARAVCNA